MKKRTQLLTGLALLAGCTLHAQNVGCTLEAGTISNVVYIPPSGLFTTGKTTAAMIRAHFPTGTSFTPDQEAAIRAACDLWAQILTFNGVPIDIDFWDDASIPSNVLATTSPKGFVTSTISPIGLVGFTSSDATRIPNLLYTWASANKLTGTDQLPNSSEMDIHINQGILKGQSAYSFYTGTDGLCPATQYDLETVVFHEISHGLGLLSSVRRDASNNMTYGCVEGPTAYPMVYDHFIINKTANPATDVLLSSIDPADYLTLTPYVTSDNLYWNGPLGIAANNGDKPKLYAPGSFTEGSSICHLDMPATDLFNAVQPKGTAIHGVSAVDVAILNEIGWGDPVAVAAGDYINIDNYNTATAISGAVITPGTPYGFYAHFYDDDASGNYAANTSWSLDVYYDGGKYTVQTGTYALLNVQMSPLPSGYNWVRDANGRVQGYLTAIVTDNDGKPFKKMIDVGIDAAPNVPYFTLDNNSQPGHCDQAYLSFWSPGATSYTIQKLGTNGTATTLATTSALSYDVTGLSEGLNYRFAVTATNATGGTTSAPLGRAKCKTLIAAYPDPVVSMAHFHISDDFVITGITLTDTRDPSNTFSQIFDGSSTTVDMDLSDLKPGIYVVTLTSPDDVQTAQIEKD